MTESEMELKRLRRENRELKKYLRNIANAVAQSIAALDGAMKETESRQRGERIGAVVHALEFTNDSLMHFGLEMDFRAINKTKKQWNKLRSPVSAG